jgi:hypothetical protein
MFRVSICSVSAAGLLLFVSFSKADAAPVGYWSFDDGTAPAAAGTLVTTVNSPAINGTGAGLSGGSAPIFSIATPVGSEIRAGIGGSILNASNDTSLYFTNPGFPGSNTGNSGSIVTVADSGGAGSVLKLASFTIEGFIRYEEFALFSAIFTKNRADGGGSTWMLDTDGGGNLRARFDSQALGLGSGSPGFNQSFTTTAAVANGLWHHVAMTYNGTTRVMDLFVDYVDVGGGTVANALVYDDSAMRFGGSGGGRAFDGNIDEVRLSDSVLAPNEFLRAVPEPSSVALGAIAAMTLLGRRRRS